MKKRKQPTEYEQSELDRMRPLRTFCVPRFPVLLKNRFKAFCAASGFSMSCYLEYMMARELRENHVDIPPMRKGNPFADKLLRRAE